MKLTQKKIDDYNIELTVTVDAAEFSNAIKRAAKILSERVAVPGFRKGKAPQAILEKHIGKDAIINEASEILLQDSTREALKILDLIPVSENKAEVITNEEGKDFVFTLTFTPYPKAILGEYKGLKVEKVVEPVTDEEVDSQVELMRQHHASLIDAPEDSTIVDGDFITLDYTGTVDGEKFTGGEAKDAPLEIGSHSFIDNFEEQLIGAKVGEELVVKVTFPENYHSKEVAGKDAEFACKINSIKHRVLPELDDEFVKKITTFQTVDEYKADIRKNMEANAESRAVEAQRGAVIDKAVENMTINLPPIMVENRIDRMINELSDKLQAQGMSLEQYLAFSGHDMDKLREDYREIAKKNVLVELMIEKVIESEGITATQDEIDNEILMLAKMYGMQPQQVIKYLKKNEQFPNLSKTICQRKAIKCIFDNMAGADDESKIAPPAGEETDTVKEKANSAEETKEN